MEAKSPVPVRMPAELKEWLRLRAESNLRSLNGEIVSMLLEEKRREEDRQRTKT
jgi:hypothetical protein